MFSLNLFSKRSPREKVSLNEEISINTVFPPEIFSIIFVFLSEKEKFTLAPKVCRDWRVLTDFDTTSMEVLDVLCQLELNYRPLLLFSL